MTAPIHTSTRPVLCGTDFSLHSTEISAAAAAIARRLEAPLVLLHVQDERAQGLFPGLIDALVDRVRARLEADAAMLRGLGGEVVEELRVGVPYEVAADRVKVTNAQLVVMGSSSKTTAGRILTGSVAERTAESSPVPTLIIRDAAPIIAWARDERPLKILVACDFSATADDALAWVREIQSLAACEIMLATVNRPNLEMRRLGLTGPINLTGNPPVVEQALHRDLQEKARLILGDIPVKIRTIAGWGRADMHLVQAAQEEQVDLIVVGTHQRHGLSRLYLGSVSRGVLHNAPMSVCVVPHTGTAAALRTIPELRRVLVATDFSKAGNEAVKQAFAVSHRGGVVRLIHVLATDEPIGVVIPPYESYQLTEQQRHEAKASLVRQLCSLVPIETEARGLATEIEVIDSPDATQAIAGEAERFGADLVCVGSNGLSATVGTALGSVAQGVMSQSRRPVLVARTERV